MKFGICTSVSQAAALNTIPFDYLEESVQRFLVPEQPQDVFESLLQAAQRLPIPIETANSFLPGDLALVSTSISTPDTQRIQRYVQTALQRAEQAGIRVIVFGSGGARKCPEGVDKADALQQIAEHLARWSGWASQHGVEIALEPLRYEETNTINTVVDGGTLVQGIEASGARLLADTYHMASNKEDPQSIAAYAPLLAHVHVAELEGRAAPGRRNFDFRPYFSALKQAGYNRRISIECNWESMPDEVERAIATIRKQWSEA